MPSMGVCRMVYESIQRLTAEQLWALLVLIGDDDGSKTGVFEPSSQGQEPQPLCEPDQECRR